MGLEYAQVLQDESPGAAATNVFANMKKSFTVQNLVLQVPARENSTDTASTLLGCTSRLDRIFLSTNTGSNVVDWEGEHLWDFDVQSGFAYPLAETGQAQNVPIGAFWNLPLSAKPFDFDVAQGAAPQRLTQIQFSWAADAVALGDSATLSLTAIGNPDISNPVGMLANVRDNFSANSAGQQRDVDVIGKTLMGVYNFGTTGYSDLAAAAAFNVTTFRDHSIVQGDAVKVGPIQDFALSAMGKAYEIGALIDEGSEVWDLGYRNTNPSGINISDGTWAYRNTRGATNAGISYPIRLI